MSEEEEIRDIMREEPEFGEIIKNEMPELLEKESLKLEPAPRNSMASEKTRSAEMDEKPRWMTEAQWKKEKKELEKQKKELEELENWRKRKTPREMMEEAVRKEAEAEWEKELEKIPKRDEKLEKIAKGDAICDRIDGIIRTALFFPFALIILGIILFLILTFGKVILKIIQWAWS